MVNEKALSAIGMTNKLKRRTEILWTLNVTKIPKIKQSLNISKEAEKSNE